MSRLLIVADLDDRQCVAIPRGLELAHRLSLRALVVAFQYQNLKGLGATAGERNKIKKELLAQREKQVAEQLDIHVGDFSRPEVQVVWEKRIHQWLTR